jgi:hypothetical protein
VLIGGRFAGETDVRLPKTPRCGERQPPLGRFLLRRALISVRMDLAPAARPARSTVMTHDAHAEAPSREAKHSQHGKTKPQHQHGGRHAYARLLIMAVLSFAAMYVLMYAMVDRFGHVHANLNQAYMAALMAAPMVAIELALMSAMYPDRRLNAVALALSGTVFVGAWFGIREQAAIGDTEFLRSMIPHHSSAILMCRKAQITDAEIQALCTNITSSQRAEIDQMEAILARKA